MKAILTSLAVIVCICLVSQAASGFEAKPSSVVLVTLSGCDSGYLVKDCDTTKNTVKRIKNYVLDLEESLNLDSNDKKKDTKTKEKVTTKKDKTKPDTKKKEPKKKTEKKKETKKVEKKKPTAKKKVIPSKTQKTKHDTVKNSIGNMR